LLELVEILPIASMGQGIAWDRTGPGVIYGLIKRVQQVVVSTLMNKK
jgi:hypothetical protein